jgi:CRISPR-associated endonuclease/helicase Cas3
VDRRAVVDQATDVAESLRDLVDRDPDFKQALGLDKRSLPISTLRGQHVDNKEWLEDPASPAIIIGTVDMIGSRILFEGYRTSRKMRPYHAGLLGADTLVVLDEAHLVPPFEKLLETIADGRGFGPRDEDLPKLVPPFKLLALSATGRPSTVKSFSLQDADLKHPVVKRRLDAPKHLLLLPPLDDQTDLEDALAQQAWTLAGNGTHPVRIIVFCDKRDVAKGTNEAIEKLAKGAQIEVERELFVGGRRIFERETAAHRLRERGFIAGTKVDLSRPAFVIATSAGEVGVDLDADHMVSDLVAWERMVQRLGRVNRRGDGEADVIVVVESEPKAKKSLQDALTKDLLDRTEKESKAVAAYEAMLKTRRARLQPFDRLPRKNGAADASPGALRALKNSAETDAELQTILDAATTPAPLRPALSRALVDAWSMTSLKQHTGRPEIDPWLRGWIDDDPPQTAIVWRTNMPVRNGHTPAGQEVEAFFEAAPPHVSEILETETYRVVQWLLARATTLTSMGSFSSEPIENEARDRAALCGEDVVAIALTKAGDFFKAWRLEELTQVDDADAKKKKEDLNDCLKGATLVLDARIGGLRAGLIDEAEANPPHTVDDGALWISETAVGFRIRIAGPGQPLDVNKGWRERLRFPASQSEEGETTRWIIVDKWLNDAATEEDRSAGRPQLLHEHQAWTEDRARELARRLHLPDAYVDMLGIAASLHDEGKRSKRWQRAFNAKRDGDYAKTLGPLNTALLDGYRHEFGSLPYAKNNERFCAIPDDLQDLALHLIAAHHGFARPIISTQSCEDAPPSVLEDRAQEIALRFARLQKCWGPWGLAWWEALLRAADQQASRDNDAADAIAAKESV